MKHQFKLVVLGVLISTYGLAADVKKATEPCKAIKEACEAAGFVQGGAKDGKGLWVNCFQPIMQGTTHPKTKLPLPTVDAQQVAACKKAQPKPADKKAGK